MLADILLPVFIAAILFAVGEYVRRKTGLSNEYSRKWIHVLHGLTVIAWSFLLPDAFIIGFESIFFVGMFVFRHVVRRWPQYGWMYDVKRRSYGEFFYPLGIIGALLITDNNLIFAAAVAQLAITDAVAALVGKTWGTSSEYKVFGATKSVAGTAAFIACAIIIFMALFFVPVPGTIIALVGATVVLAMIENVSIYGSDNLTLPLVTAAALQLIL